MEVESAAPTNEATPKKLWKLLKVVLLMVKKGFAKSKLIVDVTLHLKRSHKLAGKTIHSLILSGDHPHQPKDYEFNCNNSSTIPFFHLPKRNKSTLRRPGHLDDAVTMEAVQRVLEMINADGEELPDIRDGQCRQLKISDSPFSMKENQDEAFQVNMAADEFINKFYGNLRKEKSTPMDSPYHEMLAS